MSHAAVMIHMWKQEVLLALLESPIMHYPSLHIQEPT